ncbi:MAG: hypothetical protein RIR97_1986 [Pseudomonadota bacterium]
MADRQIAIIGGGPSGLMAADVLSRRGHRVTLYDAMPTVGRKFLLAGKSGLNLTHSEAPDLFLKRFSSAPPSFQDAISAFDARSVRAFAHDLGIETFIGTSGRVFPNVMKASPMLRAWLKRLDDQGVTICTRHRFSAFSGSSLVFETPQGLIKVIPDATLLALGGASWPKLGGDGRWIPVLRDAGIHVSDFRPANCGFDVDWSENFSARFAGAAIKSVVATSPAGSSPGECVITRTGLEGSLVYAHAATLRDRIDAGLSPDFYLVLAPHRSFEKLQSDLARQNPKTSFSNRLRKATGLDPVKSALLREILPDAATLPADKLAKSIKHLPIPLVRPRPLAEAISSAGGVLWNGINKKMMLNALPGVFVAGEMLDWEAPTGGYLLTACFATGLAAANGLHAWLDSHPASPVSARSVTA